MKRKRLKSIIHSCMHNFFKLLFIICLKYYFCLGKASTILELEKIYRICYSDHSYLRNYQNIWYKLGEALKIVSCWVLINLIKYKYSNNKIIITQLLTIFKCCTAWCNVAVSMQTHHYPKTLEYFSSIPFFRFSSLNYEWYG